MNNNGDYLVELLKELVDHNIDFIVCGGVAAVLHGVERLTIDLDISLDLNEANLKHFLEVMNKENMVPRAPIPAESILDEDIRKMMVDDKGAIVFTFVDNQNPFKQIDLFLTEDQSFKNLIDQVDEVIVDDDCVIKVVSINKLIEMKYQVAPMRDKDKRDIIELERLRGGHES